MTEAAEITIATDLVADAVEAYDRYRYAFEHDLLIQGGWHEEQDGRHLACMLGVLGKDVSDPKDCPAHVMPRWLAKMVPSFFDNMPFEDAKTWGLALYEQLARLKGQVPFSVVYDWQANSILELQPGASRPLVGDGRGWSARGAGQDPRRRSGCGAGSP